MRVGPVRLVAPTPSWPLFAVVLYVAILGVAVFFRLFQLDGYPAGVYGDEAFNGVDALKTAADRRYAVFYPGNNGREGLFIWLLSLVLKGQEPSIGTLRTVSAFAGILTVAIVPFTVVSVYLFSARRRLEDLDARTVLLGLLVMALISVSYWHINFSRIAFRAILDPLFAASAMALVCAALLWSRSFALAIAAGLVAGLGAYGYASYKFMILPFAGIALLSLLHGDLRERVQLAVVAVVAIVTAMPLALFILGNPEMAMRRSMQVSVFTTQEPFRELLTAFFKVLRMFPGPGDANLRHNLSGLPQLHRLVFGFFAIGLLWCLVPRRLWENRIFDAVGWRGDALDRRFGWLVLLWLGAMMVPSILTFEGQPHALRGIGMIVPSCILAGLGLVIVLQSVTRRWRSFAVPVAVLLCLAYGYLGIVAFNDYFVRLEKHPAYAGAFDLKRTDAARDLAGRASGKRNLVVIPAGGNTEWLLAQFRYFTAADPTAFDILPDDQLSAEKIQDYQNVYLRDTEPTVPHHDGVNFVYY